MLPGILVPAAVWDAVGAWAEDSIEIVLEVQRCQEAMGAALPKDKGKEEAGWWVTVPASARAAIAYVPIAGKKCLTREARRATP
jgi:hypothetical protein